ncbi:APC family permease [Alicyclobacillus acidiphilus]|uniref:APC family permease n=2 Tax=Alicyclobacillus acidiphilus TaxID=182455 RepID=UPI002892B6DE|nr:APC family permease [Alicyclobacillus acidiphilus]
MNQENDVQLKADSISIVDNTILGISSTAPAYSLAVSLGVIISIVGFSSPAMLVFSFIPMLGVACGFYYLNRYYGPSAGGIYKWVSGTFNRYIGYMVGWSIVAANLIFLVTGSVPSGTYTLDLFNPAWANNQLAVSLVSAVWFLLVVFLTVRGMQISARFQSILLLIEYGALLVFAVIGICRVITTHPLGSHSFSFHWFTFHGSFSAFAGGATIAIFFYWGFDSITSLGEESKDARVNPGIASIASTFGLLLVFAIMSISLQMLLPEKEIANHQDDILNYFALQIVPRPWNDIMILCVISSTVAVLVTALFPAVRVAFDMARDSVFPRIFARVHPTWRTPHFGTFIFGALGLIGIFLINLAPSVSSFLRAASTNIGIVVAFYYGVTAWSAAWFMRKHFHSPTVLIFGILLPFASGAFLFLMGGEVLVQSGFGSCLPALIAFVVGIPILIYIHIKSHKLFGLCPHFQRVHGII